MVFRFEEEYLNPLIVAWRGYQDLCGLTIPSHFDGELLALIIKAREDCPPCRWFEFEKAFQLRTDEMQWFQWFAKTFLNIPMRQSWAYYDKRSHNLGNVTEFEDDGDWVKNWIPF